MGGRGIAFILAGSLWLRLFGWKIQGEASTYKKFVLIAAPHTSNWDFPFMLQQPMQWVSVYPGSANILCSFRPGDGLCATGWDSCRPASTAVSGYTDGRKIPSRDELVLAVPPEGTRTKVNFWKSGFYHIASESGVPIGLGYLDYDRKLCGLGMFVIPSGNVNEDMDKIRNFYRHIRGKYPRLESEPRLLEETSPVESFR